MSQSNANLFEVHEYVEKLASKQRVKYFYPQTVSRQLALPLELVILELSKLIELGYIELKYEIKCNVDSTTLKTVDNYLNLIDTKIFCDICGEDIDVLYSNIYPLYCITDCYKEFAKKKLKN